MITPASSWGILIRKRELIHIPSWRKRQKATCSPSFQSIHHRRISCSFPGSNVHTCIYVSRHGSILRSQKSPVAVVRVLPTIVISIAIISTPSGISDLSKATGRNWIPTLTISLSTTIHTMIHSHIPANQCRSPFQIGRIEYYNFKSKYSTFSLFLSLYLSVSLLLSFVLYECCNAIQYLLIPFLQKKGSLSLLND